MEQSLEDAIQEAIQMSKDHPNVKIKVMSKKGQEAVVTGSDWVYRERILEGWNTIATYQNGQVI